MKKVWSTAAGVLIALGVTMGGAATAFADNTHSHGFGDQGQRAQQNQQKHDLSEHSKWAQRDQNKHDSNQKASGGQASNTQTSNVSITVGKSNTHGKSAEQHGKEQAHSKDQAHSKTSSSSKGNKAQHQQELAQLKTEITAMKTAHKKDQQAHHLLVQAEWNFEQALQGQIAAGNTSAVSQAVAQAQDVNKVLHQAITDEKQATKDTLSADREQKHGGLTNAINVMTQAANLLTAEGQLMSNAATYLTMMTQELESSAGSFGNNTTNNTANSTTGDISNFIWNGVNTINSTN